MCKLALMAILAFAAGTVLGQTSLNRKQEKEVVTILADVGATCTKISRTQAVGQLPDKSVLMAVACTDGGQYVILMDRRANMSFYSTCENLAKANNNLVRCFT